MPTYIVEINKAGKIPDVINWDINPIPNDPSFLWKGEKSDGVRVFAENVEEAIHKARGFLVPPKTLVSSKTYKVGKSDMGRPTLILANANSLPFSLWRELTRLCGHSWDDGDSTIFELLLPRRLPKAEKLLVKYCWAKESFPCFLVGRINIQSGKVRKVHRCFDGSGDIKTKALECLQRRIDNGTPWYGDAVIAITPLGQRVSVDVPWPLSEGFSPSRP